MWRSDARRATTSSSRSARSNSIVRGNRPPSARIEPIAPAGTNRGRLTHPFCAAERGRGAALAAGAGDAGDFGHGGHAEAHLLHAVVAQAPHALTSRHLGDLVSRGARDGQPAHFLGESHDLVEADASLVAAVAAARAADGLVGGLVGVGVEAVVAKDLGGEHGLALAVGAQRPGQALRDDAVDRPRDEEGLDAYL